ncbi:MAG: methylmalonyl Co-A mutase-associated GTPase MeaB [Actinomycetota bacterium]
MASPKSSQSRADASLMAGVPDLVTRALDGERRAIARLISLVEDGGAELAQVMDELYPHTGRAYSIGITGAPGSGKSTLTERLVGRIRTDDLTVAVLAIDPSSPFSGGALLGDRVRMQNHALDTGVFIRSMATRGHLGGLSLATPEAVRVLDAVGNDIVVIETVGVGQAEVEITDACDTTLVVLNPGWGDAVQTAKAGLMEIADVFVVNKADRPGARDTVREIRQMLDMSDAEHKPEVVSTVATKGEGFDELWAAIEKHRNYQEERGLLEARRRRRIEREIKEIVAEQLRQRVESEGNDELQRLTDEVVKRACNPYQAADRLLRTLDGGAS